MVESVMVTLKDSNSSFSLDLELPAQISVAELKKRLKELFPDVDFSRITRNQILLKDNQTLEQQKVWDGSILEAERGIEI